MLFSGDLWGPLFICLLLSLYYLESKNRVLSLTSPISEAPSVFTSVFFIIWLGSFAVTINAQLLNVPVYTPIFTNSSFFQSMCLLGYCIFPIAICSIFFIFINYFALKLVIVIVAFIWSSKGKYLNNQII